MELPKLLVKWREKIVSPWDDGLIRWLFLLEGSENEEILKTLEEIAMQDPVLNQAIEEWGKSSDDPKVREEYFAREKAVLDEKAAIREMELRLTKALKEGQEKGKKEANIAAAKKLLSRGMDIQSISEILGIPEEVIRNLR